MRCLFTLGYRVKTLKEMEEEHNNQESGPFAGEANAGGAGTTLRPSVNRANICLLGHCFPIECLVHFRMAF